jgi:hypothetical protein
MWRILPAFPVLSSIGEREGVRPMLCSRCSKPVADGAQFCGGCGQRVEAAPTGAASGSQFTPAWAAAGAPAGAAAVPGIPTTAPGLIERIKNILLSPRTEWPVIEPESTPVGQLVTGYVLPLAAFAVVMSFVHMAVIGISLPFGGSIRTPMLPALSYSLFALVAGVIGVCIIAFIVNTLAPRFGGTRDTRQAFKVAAYSLTPAWVGVVFSLLPSFGTLLQFVAGCYGIYTLYLGLPVLMRSNRERAGSYTASVVVITVLLGILLGVVSAAVGVGRVGAMGAFGAATSDEQDAAAANAAASVIGGALGTDEKGKAGLASALSTLAKAGQQMDAEAKARAASASSDAVQGSGVQGGAGSAETDAAKAAGGLLTALGGALGGGRHVEPVDFHTLAKALPETLPGMTREDMKGSGKEALGVKGTQASAIYRAADARIEIEIADASGVAGLMDLATSLVANETSESSTGYERTSKVGGRVVHEKYDSTTKHAELDVIVAKRFTIGLSGDGVEMSTLEHALAAVDVGALEAMKDAGAQ